MPSSRTTDDKRQTTRPLAVLAVSSCLMVLLFVGCRSAEQAISLFRISTPSTDLKLAETNVAKDRSRTAAKSTTQQEAEQESDLNDSETIHLANHADTASQSKQTDDSKAASNSKSASPKSPGLKQLSPSVSSDSQAETNDGQMPEIPLTLNQVVFACLNDHPTIAAALESIEQTRADYLTATLFPNPELFTDVQLLPLTRPFTIKRQGGPPQQDVILSYPIDWFLFGKRAAEMNTASHRVHVTEAEFQDLVRQRVLLAATSFYDALEAQAIVRLANESTQNLREVERITQLAVEDGGRPAVELSRVRLDLLVSEQVLRTSRALYVGKEARLKAIVGQLQNGMRIRPDGDLGSDLSQPLPSLDAAISIAEAERPDLNAIRWRIAAECAEVDFQRTRAKPTMTPALGYTRQYQEKAIGFPDADSWSGSLTMSVPILDRNQGNISRAMSTQRKAQWELQVARLTVHADVQEALAEVSAAELNAQSVADQQLELATKVWNSIVESYELGGRPLLDVLDAQRNYRETNRLFITSRANYWRALFRFYAAIGRQPESHE